MNTDDYEIIFTNTAKEELENIYLYIAESLSEKMVADKMMEKIEQKFFRLEKYPYSCTEVRIKPHNDIYRKLVIDNYIVLYEIDEKYKKVVIYRVLYEKIDYLKMED